MDMKWHPIIDGDLSGIPRDKRLLFSGIDQGELYVDFGYVDSRLEKHVIISIGDIETPIKAEEFTEWMELPSPFHPNVCTLFPSMIVIFRNNSERMAPIRLITYDCMEDPISVSDS